LGAVHYQPDSTLLLSAENILQPYLAMLVDLFHSFDYWRKCFAMVEENLEVLIREKL
jgi:hypothetical protein